MTLVPPSRQGFSVTSIPRSGLFRLRCWRKRGGRSPCRAGRAAAGTMAAQVTVTSHHRPAPLGTTTAMGGLMAPAQPHAAQGGGPAVCGDRLCPVSPKRDGTRHGANVCQAAAPARGGGGDVGQEGLSEGSPHREGGLGVAGPHLGCCRAPLLSVTSVANAVEGLHSHSGENESPRKGSAAAAPGPPPAGPFGSCQGDPGVRDAHPPPPIALLEAIEEQRWCRGGGGCTAALPPSEDAPGQGPAGLVATKRARARAVPGVPALGAAGGGSGPAL